MPSTKRKKCLPFPLPHFAGWTWAKSVDNPVGEYQQNASLYVLSIAESGSTLIFPLGDVCRTKGTDDSSKKQGTSPAKVVSLRSGSGLVSILFYQQWQLMGGAG